MIFYVIYFKEPIVDAKEFRFVEKEARDEFLKQLPTIYHKKNLYTLDIIDVDPENDDYVCPICGQKPGVE